MSDQNNEAAQIAEFIELLLAHPAEEQEFILSVFVGLREGTVTQDDLYSGCTAVEAGEITPAAFDAALAAMVRPIKAPLQ